MSIAMIGCRAAPRAPAAETARAPSGAPLVGEIESNVLRADYAGSQACAKCHKEIYAAWSSSPMHQMTRLPVEARIHAPFGSEFHFKDDRVKLEQDGRDRYLRIESQKYGNHLFKITKVIGGHHREDFAGVEVDAGAPGLPPVGDSHVERVLPISWMIDSQSFRYKGYSVMVRERPGLRPGGVWNKTCIFCHNTVPFIDTIYGAIAGPGTKPYQGEVVDPLLPESKRWSFEITDRAAFERAVTDELAFIGARAAPNEDAAQAAVRGVRARFDARHLLEVGIGCESCHGGSRAHTEHVGLSPSLLPRSAFLRVRAPSPPSRAEQINRTCARCHQVLFSQYPYTWEGGLRNREPGGSNINSGEARDFLLGACSSKMSCVNCHDPHAPDNRARMESLEGKAGNKVCLDCHKQYSSDEALRAHSHHSPDGAGGVCMNCHMPRKNFSLETRLTRYHRVGSPTDRVRVERDRPLECALCHADKSIVELVETMEKWWNKNYDRDALYTLYGDLKQNALVRTVEVGKPHEQNAALSALGEARARAAAPLVAAQLTHEYPIIRYYALSALQSMLGKPVSIDLHRDDALIRADAARILTEHGLKPIDSAKSEPSNTHSIEGED